MKTPSESIANRHHRRRLDDRGHLRLRDPQLGLRAAQLGDVDEHALGVQRPVGRVAHDRLLVEQVHDRAVGGHEAVLEVDRDLLARVARELLDDPVAVAGVHHGGPELRVLGPALRRIARERLDLRADVADRDGLVVVADVGDGRHLLDEPAEARLGLLERRLRGVQAAEVAQEADEQRLALDVGAGDRQLDGDPGAVAAHGRQLQAASEDRRLARREVTRQARGVALAQLRRHEQLGEAAPVCLLAGVAERALGRGVEVHDQARRVHRDDAVERGLEHRLAARVSRAGVGVRGGPGGTAERGVHRGDTGVIGL